MIITACDKNYLSEAEILIKSCARQEPNQRFYLYLVEGTPDQVLLVQSWHPNIIVECTAWPYKDQKFGMMYCLRSIPLRKVLEQYREPTIYLDSDIILRTNLKSLFEMLEHYDVIVRYRPGLNYIGAAGTPHGATFNNGVIAIRASKQGIRFAQEYDLVLEKYLLSGKPLTTYNQKLGMKFVVDQELLYVVFESMKDHIVFEPLPEIFNDARFNRKSVIWHGKGAARKHPAFVIEKKRYKQKFFYHPLGMVNWILWRLRQLKRQLKSILYRN